VRNEFRAYLVFFSRRLSFFSWDLIIIFIRAFIRFRLVLGFFHLRCLLGCVCLIIQFHSFGKFLCSFLEAVDQLEIWPYNCKGILDGKFDIWRPWILGIDVILLTLAKVVNVDVLA
jgi:hypothetical protein